MRRKVQKFNELEIKAEKMASDQDLLFKTLLMSISNQLTTEDLDKMKFGLELPQGTLEDVQKPFGLFRRMMNAKLLSAENRGQLASLLQFAGRFDLSKELTHHHMSQFRPTDGELLFTSKYLVYSMLLSDKNVWKLLLSFVLPARLGTVQTQALFTCTARCSVSSLID